MRFTATIFSLLLSAGSALAAEAPYNSGFGTFFDNEVPPSLAGRAEDAGPVWAIEPSAGDAPAGSVTIPAEILAKDYSAELRQQERAPRLKKTPAEKLPHARPQDFGFPSD